MTIIAREQTRHDQKGRVESLPDTVTDQSQSTLIELRQQPPPAHVAVRGRAVEMVGLPLVIAPANDREERSDR